MTLAAGTKLGRYEIRSKLGEGGMGEVYLALDTGELGRPVAIKLLSPEVAANPQRMQRFVQEAKTVSAFGSAFRGKTAPRGAAAVARAVSLRKL
jgi:hypothetical protein